MKTLKSAALAIALGCLSMPAKADLITWDFVDAGASGGSITGSYTYDADTNLFSSVSVMISGGSLPDWILSFANPFGPSSANSLSFHNIAGPDLNGAQGIFVFLEDSMTNAGGTIGLFSVFTGTCVFNDCTSLIPELSRDESPFGSVVAREVAVPEPGTLALLGIGLAGMGLARRRKKV